MFYFTQIKWENRKVGDTGNDCLVSVDGVDFEIQEPFPYVRGVSQIWFSHKFKGPGLRYEVGICIKSGHCVWLNGPYACGKYNDCSIFLNGMAKYLEKDERVEADDGYKNASPQYAKVPSFFFAKEERLKIQSNVRARHETFNKRLKQWGALSKVWEHNARKHSLGVRAVVVITQIILHYEPLFEVEYED